MSIIISADEDSDVAATRELRQSLGLVVTLEFLATLAIAETPVVYTQFYRAYTDARPIPDSHEIESIEFVDLERLARQMTSDPHRFTRDFHTLIRWYRANVMA